MRTRLHLHYILYSLIISITAGRAFAFLPPQNPQLEVMDKRAGASGGGAAPSTVQVTARETLRSQVPGVQVDFDPVLGSPKLISAREGFLSGPNGTGNAISASSGQAFASDPYGATKAFLNDHRDLFGFGPEALGQAKISREFQTAHNGLKTVVWQQQLDGIPLFETVLISHTTKYGELVNVCSQFIPDPTGAAGLGASDRTALEAAPTISAAQAVAEAARNVGDQAQANSLIPSQSSSAGALGIDKRQEYSGAGIKGTGEARLIWLPMSKDELRLCWQVVFTSQSRGEMYLVIVDAQSGAALVRHNLTAYISPATYNVFTSDSPSPFSPGHPTPLTNQPPLISRTLVTIAALDTNASPSGWIDDGGNETRGNNVDAHTDRNADNVPDLPRPQGSPARTFDFPMDLTTQDPTNYSSAAVVQLFYLCNWMHDKLYQLGFNEAAGNFQSNNFGRGGLGNDAVAADAQDGSGTDNANFSTPPDGSPGRMQMYLFTGPSPRRDGDLDAEVVLHEYTHGLSNRRVGGGVGISQLQPAGMGEGWSDFYGLSLLSQPGDDVNGNYAAGAYASFRIGGPTDQSNYYFGIRRYPYTTDMTKNPLTFKDLDPAQAANCLSAAPYHTGMFGSCSTANNAEVHNEGELWCVTLWEARARLVNRYGWTNGNQLILQLVTDGMNLSPANPTFLQGRDAIIQADQVDTGGANRNDLWAAFAKRGMGFSATSPANTTTTGVHEAFDLPDNLLITPSTGFISRGPVGGPFTPSSQVYALTNIGTNVITWTLINTSSWISFSSSGGVLNPAGSTSVTGALTAAAASLPMGIYSTTAVFSNQVSGVGLPRQFSLRIGQPDYFTELFAANTNDTAFQMFTFTPDGSTSFYSPCRQNIAAFPTDPTGGTSLVLGDDTSAQIIISGGNTVAIYNTRTNVLFIGSNGYITMRSGDTTFSYSLAAHFNLPRVSALFRDLNPGAGGTVSWKQLGDRLAVTFQGVPNFGTTTTTNSFQFELFFDGRIRVSYLTVRAIDGLAGLSAGTGVPVNFEQSDLTSYGPCSPLSVILPASAQENAGVISGGGAVWLASPLPTNLVVTLTSSVPAKLTVPATSTILAGQVSNVFDLTLIDNSINDGNQTVTVGANAPGFTNNSASILVIDDDTAPIILANPVSQTVPPGSAVTFSVLASGKTPLSYFWRRNGNPITGATSSSYTTNNVQLADSGAQFSCLVSNVFGTTNSTAATLFVSTVTVAHAVFVRSTIGDPWGMNGGETAMDRVFGTNNWQDLRYETVASASLWTPLNTFIYLEGSDNNAAVLLAFLATNRPLMQAWVSNGGGLFINAGPNVGANIDVGFGVTINYDGATTFTATGIAANPSHQIFSGPFTPVGTNWTGDWFAHALISGPGLTPLIINQSNSLSVLSEKRPGLGRALFGGMTDPGFHTPQPQGPNLRANILAYTGGGTGNSVTQTLVFFDSTSGTSTFAVALTNLSMPNQYFGSGQETAFQTAVSNANPATTMVIVDAPGNVHTFNYLSNFVNSGGRTILEYYDLDGSPAIAALFQATPVGDISTAIPVYDWGNSGLFAGVASPLGCNDSYLDDGDRLQAAGGALGVAGFVSSSTANQAAIVIGNSGRTIVNGFLLEEATNTLSATQLAANEILFLTGTIPIGTAPLIVTQPANQSVVVGDSPTFTVSASGTTPLSYFWRRNGSFIAGATASSYTTNNVQLSDSGALFSCLVSNVYGSILSSNALLTVTALPPSIDDPPFSQIVPQGGIATFSVLASGSGTLTYQWKFNGTNIAGATGTSYTINPVLASSGGDYSVGVSNIYGGALSDPAKLTVLVASSSADFILNGNYVSLPVATNGQFLSLFFSQGGRFNPAGTGGTNGTDFWFPGSPICDYSVGVNSNVCADGAFNTLTVSNLSVAGLLHASIIGTLPGPAVFRRDVSFATNDRAIRIVDTIQNTGGGSISNAATLDSPDPDQGQDGTPTASYETANDVVSVLSLNDAVVARSTNNNLTLLMGSESASRVPSAIGFDNINPYWFLTVVDPNGFAEDIAINLAQNYGSIPPSQIKTSVWFMVFGTSVNDVTNRYASVATTPPPIINDTCSNALVITGLAYTNAQSTAGVSSTGDPLPGCGAGFGSGVWYKYIPTLNGKMEVDTVGSDFDTILAVYLGTCGALTQVSCDDDSGGGVTSRTAPVVTALQTYYILAGGYGGESGNLVLHLNFTPSGTPPGIVSQPSSQTSNAGDTATFSVLASGSLPLSYQWRHSGTNLPGATQDTLTLPNIRTNDAGIYLVVVTNTYGSVTSAPASLTVIALPTLSVLLIWDTNSPATSAFTNALAGAGFAVTPSATDETGYNGNNPSPIGFGAVIHLNGVTYTADMPISGQNALASYVQNGGGYIGTEWDAYEFGLGRMANMRELILLDRASGDNGLRTLQVIAAQSGHPVLAGLAPIPSTFTYSAGVNLGLIHSFATNPAVALVKDGTNDAVAVRQVGLGRVVSFSHAGNYEVSTPLFNTLMNSNVQQLFINALLWVGRKTPAPTIQAFGISSNRLVLTYPTYAGQTCYLETNNFLVGAWKPMKTNLGDGTTVSITNSTSSPRLFYRLRIQ